MSVLTLITANLAGHRTVPELAKVVDRDRPDVVVCTEAQNARAFLKSLPGYRLEQYRRSVGAEAPDVAILLRYNVQLVARWPMRMARRWIGPLQGKRHTARVYPIQRVRIDGKVWRIAAVHFPTGGFHGTNAAAWDESARRIIRWAQRNPSGPLVAVGDFNEVNRDVRGTNSMQGLARAIGGALLPGTKVDHAIMRGAIALHDAERLATPAGMHGWLRYRFGAVAK